MTLDRVLIFQADRIRVYWDSEKDSVNLRDYHIHLYYAAYAFFDHNRAEIYDYGNSTIDPENSSNDKERHAIIGFIRDVPLFVVNIVIDDGSESRVEAVRIYSARKATRKEVEKFYIAGKKRAKH